MQRNLEARYIVQQDDIKDKYMLNGRRRSSRLKNKRRAKAAGEVEHDLSTLLNNKPKLFTKLLTPNYWSKESNFAINEMLSVDTVCTPSAVVGIADCQM